MSNTQIYLVQPTPWGNGNGVDGLVIRAMSKQEAETMAADYHATDGQYTWHATPLLPEGEKRIIFGAERSCWELES
jgi:hypothetical protein